MFSLVTVSAGAQPANFDAISDRTDALADALLATPNRETPVPDVNLFATAPDVTEATTRLGTIRLNALPPLYYASNAEGVGSGGSTSAEANPEVNWSGYSVHSIHAYGCPAWSGSKPIGTHQHLVPTSTRSELT